MSLLALFLWGLANMGCASDEQGPSISLANPSWEEVDESIASASMDTVPNIQIAADVARGTATSMAAHEAYVPHPEDILPLPWADFYEMHTPAKDSEGMTIDGRLEIEGRCAYIDFRVEYETQVEEPQRLVLSLPRGELQLDALSNELWWHYPPRHLEGPIAAGERIRIHGIYGSRRSTACGDELIATTDAIWGCRRWPTTDRPLCEVEEYARRHSVQRDEAQRRLDLIPALQAVFEELKAIEIDRTAGWGFDHGREFSAWFWLTGTDSPSEKAQALAVEHPELEFRTGAAASYYQLLEVQSSFTDGKSLYLARDVGGEESGGFELANAVTRSWIDHGENELVVAVDPDWVPRNVASVLMAGEHSSYSDKSDLPRHLHDIELLLAIQRVIERRLDAPLRVTRGSKFP